MVKEDGFFKGKHSRSCWSHQLSLGTSGWQRSTVGQARVSEGPAAWTWVKYILNSRQTTNSICCQWHLSFQQQQNQNFGQFLSTTTNLGFPYFTTFLIRSLETLNKWGFSGLEFLHNETHQHLNISITQWTKFSKWSMYDATRSHESTQCTQRPRHSREFSLTVEKAHC